jgi:hypothetical protein
MRRFSATGPRNTLVEHFYWGTEGQRLSRPLVQLQSGPLANKKKLLELLGRFHDEKGRYRLLACVGGFPRLSPPL